MKLILCGARGKMGSAISNAVIGSDKFDIVCRVDKIGGDGVYTDICDFNGKADVIVDFSNHDATLSLLSYALYKKIPLVIGTTAHTEKELSMISSASKDIPIIISENYSLWIYEIIKATRSIMKNGKYRIEIIECHAKSKRDMPSGTALMIKKELCEYSFADVKIISLRADTDIVYHKIALICDDERVELIHKVFDRSLFARGALRASEFIANKQNGIYEMGDII